MRVLALALVVCCIACGGNVGNSDKTGTPGGGGTTTAAGGTRGKGGSSATSGMGGTGLNVPTSGVRITSCTGNFPFIGTWEGSILDFYFEPKQALKLELDADDSGEIIGKLTWGEGAPPPAPQSADIPYPPGYWEQQTERWPTSFEAPEPWPGFSYTIVRGAGCDTVFRFSVSTAELWQDWCALQTPVNTPNYGWGCTVQGGGSSDATSCTVQPPNGDWKTYPLWKCEACGAFADGGVCACDANGCFANTAATLTFNLAFPVSGDTNILSGPDPSCGDCTVRLQRTN
jgi:hypothetical protein